MNKTLSRIAGPLILLLPMTLEGCVGDELEDNETATVRIASRRLVAFAALPTSIPRDGVAATAAQVALGRSMFFNKNLSADRKISCNSCHLLDNFGVDGKRFSTGHKGQLGNRNAPSVYNAAGHIAQFVDGRAKDVEAQAKGPILNPAEMAMPNEKAVMARLEGCPKTVRAFAAAFPQDKPSLSFDNLARAIAAFERQLVTPSRWDRYLEGDKAALSDDEKEGFETFARVGCATCHSGPYVGGRSYRKLGLRKAWPDLKDKGRGAINGDSRKDYQFKVASLRNVAKTGPYFHDGSVSDLGQAVRMMAEYQLGLELDAAQVASIVTWLGSLSGELPLGIIRGQESVKTGKGSPSPAKN